jgi:hypothetical protein
MYLYNIGTYIILNIPPRKEEGYYIFSLKVGGILHYMHMGRHLPFLETVTKL